MSHFNVYSSHPIISPPESVGKENHYVSISSQDRNLIKNPDSDDFTIDLPQDYVNVESVKLASSYFPIVDNQFSIQQNNVDLCFRFTSAFNPLTAEEITLLDALSYVFISECILRGDYFRLRIRDGRYNKNELANEIQNKMNQEVTNRLARRIYSTQRFRQWGDFNFLMSYYIGSNEQSDTNPVDLGFNTRGGGQIDVYYNSQYPSIIEAIKAFNEKHSYNLPIPDLTNGRVRTSLPITPEDLIAIARKSTPLNPPILLAWDNTLFEGLLREIDFSRGEDSTTYKMFRTAEFEDIASISTTNASIYRSEKYDASVKKAFFDSGGYGKFKIVVDEVTTKFNIGNLVDNFEIITDKENYYTVEILNLIREIGRGNLSTYKSNLDTSQFMPKLTGYCDDVIFYTDDLKWGLPIYLGLEGFEETEEFKYDTGEFRETKGVYLPTYDYYDKSSPKYQPFKRLSAGFKEASIFLLVPTYQLDVKGEPYFFMDLDKLNCIDEVAPYKETEFSLMNNMSTGNPNSAFAKLPLSILDDVAYSGSQATTKTYNPPLDRLRKLSIRLRFHNGRPVNFGVQPFSFVLQITCAKKSFK
jgi:hypothetical protein